MNKLQMYQSIKVLYNIPVCNMLLLKEQDHQEKLNEHMDICCNHEAVRAVLPVKASGKDVIVFKNYDKTFQHPFSVFLDFESTLVMNIEEEGKYQKHICNSAGLKYNCMYD